MPLKVSFEEARSLIEEGVVHIVFWKLESFSHVIALAPKSFFLLREIAQMMQKQMTKKG